MLTEKEIDHLWTAYRAALKKISGSSGKTANGLEKGYGEAYQALVKAGQVPQLRARYR